MLYQTVQAKEANIRKQVAEAILSSLRYPTITERFEEVAEAHEQTFDWIFEHRSVDDKVPWDDFVHWLEHGDGIYWINGKAASGKSTLMKYIYQSPKTRKYLTEWASGTVLRRAGFFFWNSGTKEQRTQAGLLRSLLHDVLQQAPNLIPVVLPSQWASQYASKTDMAVVSSVDSWSLKTLSIAFQVLVSQTEIPMKLCLFIDGLDEYDGSDLDIAKLFGDVVVSTHVKVCTSSRPHVVFEDAFSKRPQLRLQDLTSNDIRRYVLDRLVGDPMMEQMACKEPARCTELVSEIVGNADGVFLWVTLVVTSLLNGLANGDRISHLQKRLKTLPKDLTALYKHMVLMIDEVYQEEASQIYQIIYAAAEQPGDIVPAKPPTILLLSFAMADDPDLVFTADFGFLTETDILQQCKSMDTMLRTRCGGLIETQFAGSGAANPTPWMKVSYLHRTVRDFLETKEIQAIIKEHSADYNPNIALLKGAILQLKVSRVGRHLGLGFTDKAAVLAQARTYLRRGDDAKYAKLGDIFAEFFKVGSKLDDGNRHSPFSSTQHLADACRMQVPKQKIMEIRQSKLVGQRWLWR
ncbi:hypothetical protein BKA61DRAFT_494586 [Leptodontidium sp. MPI-SDFR-AT-0119]|nr:hypothetical protein BKA61DRAFT_494586 [Leptodontidium sp. MPI-SDFR-AT-0119]